VRCSAGVSPAIFLFATRRENAGATKSRDKSSLHNVVAEL
jgi:hypothetical protein